MEDFSMGCTRFHQVVGPSVILKEFKKNVCYLVIGSALMYQIYVFSNVPH